MLEHREKQLHFVVINEESGCRNVRSQKFINQDIPVVDNPYYPMKDLSIPEKKHKSKKKGETQKSRDKAKHLKQGQKKSSVRTNNIKKNSKTKRSNFKRRRP